MIRKTWKGWRSSEDVRKSREDEIKERKEKT